MYFPIKHYRPMASLACQGQIVVHAVFIDVFSTQYSVLAHTM